MPASEEEVPSDEALVERFRRGDEEAFETLVHRHRQAVYRLAWRLSGGHAEADDIAQEAFLRAYRGLGRFRGDSRFRTWLTRIVINLAVTHGAARRPTVPLDRLPLAHPGAGAADTALRTEIRSAVETLSPRQRQVLVLKAYEGMKFVEIAAAAGMSVGTAKATFFQAVQRLRERLGVAGRKARREEAGS